MTATPPAWPWLTTGLVAAQFAAHVLAGAADDYVVAGDGDERQLSSVSQLTFDTIRHPSTAVMAATLAFFVPVAVVTERAVHPVAVGGVYIVAGFGAGLSEAVAATDPFTVVGTYGATTGVLAMWVATHWRHHRDLVSPTAVTLAWLLISSQLRTDGVPWLATLAATTIGLYAVGALTPHPPAARPDPPGGGR